MITFFKAEDFDLLLANRPPEVLEAVIKCANAKLESHSVEITFGAEGNFYGKPPQEIYKHAGLYVRIDSGPEPLLKTEKE